jgi:hypothetical protein
MRRKRKPSSEDSDNGRAVPINEHLLAEVVDLVDGLGWAVYELLLQSDEADRDDRLEFLSNWRNLRHNLTASRPCEFNYYGIASEWFVGLRYIFRDGSAFHHPEDTTFEEGQAIEDAYQQFLAGYDPDEDRRARR